MDLHLKVSRPDILTEEDRIYFQNFCSTPCDSDGTGSHHQQIQDDDTQAPYGAKSPVEGPIGPWWRRLPHAPKAEHFLDSGAPLPLQRSPLTPTTSLCGGPPQSPGGHRMRLEAVQMQEAVMKDLLEARKASRGRADTPADLLLSMLSDMLLGHQPDLGDVALAKSLLLRHANPYQPLHLSRQMREANLDADVVLALMHQLGASASVSEPATPRTSRTGGAPKPCCSGAAAGPCAGTGTGCSGGGTEKGCARRAASVAGGGVVLCVAVGGAANGAGDGGGEEPPETAADGLRGGLALLLGLPAAAETPPLRRQRLTAAAAAVQRGPEHEVGASCNGDSTSGSDSDCGPQPHSPRLAPGSVIAEGDGGGASVPPPLLEEVERVLALADAWQYDTWRLAEVTQGHALSCLGFYLLHREGLISQFRIRPTKLARLLRALEAGYPANPYHNSTHAADVLQTLHVLLRGAGLTGHYLDRVGLMAAYFAAVIHDHGHPGLTADFLIATSDPLAVRYNDRSPLENHHGASFFGLLGQPGMDALGGLSAAERAVFRKQVLDLVLATDMKQHFALLAHFNTAHRLAPYNKDTGPWALAHSGNGGGGRQPQPRCDLEPLGTEQGQQAGQPQGAEEAAGGAAPPLEDPRPLDETERVLSLQIALKAADLGHLGEQLEVHKRWVRSLEEEFFRQGDLERHLGLPISPLFDRAKQGVSKSQVGFYDFIALPLVHSLASAFPGAKPLLACFVGNYDHWRGVDEAAAAAAVATERA